MLTDTEDTRVLDPLDDGLQHGAHIACQFGAPFVVLACGIAADWDERNDDSTGRDMCALCWGTDHCPICGMTLEKTK